MTIPSVSGNQPPSDSSDMLKKLINHMDAAQLSQGLKHLEVAIADLNQDVAEDRGHVRHALLLNSLQKHQILYYLHQLLVWNKTYNLTAITDWYSALVKHIFDCLTIVTYLPEGALLDVGTGAGLPGMIIKICQPQRAVSLLDSNQKKIRFIRQMVAELGLSEVTPIASRVESVQGSYEVITARAFAGIADFVGYGESLLHPAGHLVAMTGQQSQLPDTLQHQWQSQSYQLKVPALTEQRHLLIIQRRQTMTNGSG